MEFKNPTFPNTRELQKQLEEINAGVKTANETLNYLKEMSANNLTGSLESKKSDENKDLEEAVNLNLESNEVTYLNENIPSIVEASEGMQRVANFSEKEKQNLSQKFFNNNIEKEIQSFNSNDNLEMSTNEVVQMKL